MWVNICHSVRAKSADDVVQLRFGLRFMKRRYSKDRLSASYPFIHPYVRSSITAALSFADMSFSVFNVFDADRCADAKLNATPFSAFYRMPLIATTNVLYDVSSDVFFLILFERFPTFMKLDVLVQG